MKSVIGIDLGGTNIQGARVDPEGEFLAVNEVKAEVAEGGEATMARIIEVARALVDDSVRAIGVCSPGIIDPVEGVSLSEAVNIPGWDGMPIKARIEEATGLPAFVENDANAAAAAEAWIGAGRGEKVVLMLTLGTGIGGGAVVDGEIYNGKSNRVAEFGHISICHDGKKCGCGNTGCLEAYASANALAARAREVLHESPAGRMLELAGGDIESVECKTACDAAREGDELACRVLDEVCGYLACGVGSLINAFNPSVVVMTGGMSLAGDVVFGRVQKELEAGRAYPPILADCRVVPGVLGNRAGMIGAARVAWNWLAKADA